MAVVAACLASVGGGENEGERGQDVHRDYLARDPSLVRVYMEHLSALERDAGDLRAMSGLAAILRAMGRAQEAKDAFYQLRRKSMEVRDVERLEEAWIGLSSIARESGEHVELQAVQECFACGRLWVNLGIFKKNSMGFGESVRCFRLALRLGQRDSNVYRQLTRPSL
eukprot:760341-Hanusia_phi.AAC.6